MKPKFLSPLPDLQIAFYKRLEELRSTFFLQALMTAASELEIPRLDGELARFVSPSHLKMLASWGLRGELLFSVPCLLSHQPQLLGYYRLLLGFSQKEFYGSNYGFGPFKSMEERGALNKAVLTALPELCHSLCKSSEHLLSSVGPLSKSSLHEMTLLTFGAQLRGGLLNRCGRDVSNIHNRIGEAEKSHQKARKDGFVECWTIVGISKLDMAKASKESPSTDRFFTLAKITEANTVEARAFKEDLLSRLNIKN